MFTLWDPHLQTSLEAQGKWGWWATWHRCLLEKFGFVLSLEATLGHLGRDRMPVGRDPVRLCCLRRGHAVHTWVRVQSHQSMSTYT